MHSLFIRKNQIRKNSKVMWWFDLTRESLYTADTVYKTDGYNFQSLISNASKFMTSINSKKCAKKM